MRPPGRRVWVRHQHIAAKQEAKSLSRTLQNDDHEPIFGRVESLNPAMEIDRDENNQVR